ncbi:hypothetical protein PIB30_069495 [Stylosanthes scabra]|uniref:Kinesin-like protein n=1 Tax=Stylosanthes scabra TaxID=79078 RepID=A0ABU6SPT2_9FABA|nr:hypothetical protein [Stylosanthes scabra]
MGETPPAATPMSKIQGNLLRTPSGGAKLREEKIRVTVRMRPLNRKEQAMYDLIAWECFHERSIIFKNPNHERPATPYTFDKVFAPSCSTQKVYEEGARDVALSALSGINATIFAYGQTSSGKTFTMRGIVENAIKDIYDYIKNKPERHFILKIAALEIYNETVIDLLNPESGPLRLLDDPETLESSLHESSGHVKSYVASLNFVDLAGSERISQTKTCGVRLKEGNHINRSLLTLSTVIRKLSGGKRGHIPYRDSKLTRILQSALGGNARTAIICTISPSLSHVEQTKNTLTFATSAKEVVNNARVNMVVSDKTLVRQLQKEVARLEGELRSPELSSSSSRLRSLLAEKELKITQMEKDMEDLRRQRDLAQSQLELERRANKVHKGSNDHGPSGQVVRCLSFPEENESAIGKHSPDQRKVVGRQAMLKNLLASPDPSILVGEIRKLEHRQLQLCEDANRALEVLHKDFATHNLGNQETAETMSKVLSEIKDLVVAGSSAEEIVTADKADLMKKISQLKNQGNTIASLERKLENVQKSIDKLVSTFGTEETPDSSKTQLRRKKILPFTLSNSPNMQHIIRAPCSPLSSSCKAMELEIENRVPTNNNIGGGGTFARLHKDNPRKGDESCNSILSREGSPAARQSKSVDVKKIQKMFKNAAEENIKSFKVYVTELKELVAKLHYQKQLLVCQVLELEANKSANEETDTTGGSPVPWEFLFEQQRQQIIMLWHLCHISLVHRTQFYLLLRGDPSDQIYMEVEFRRLTWLEQHLAELGNASPALLGDEPAGHVSASIRALRQEREYLAKRVNSKLTAEERELLYAKWEVPPVGKQRRLQFINKLWTDPYNMHHVQESAEIVAKLIDFCGSDENSKDMFELNFASPYNKKTWGGWNFISNLLNL